VNFYHPAFEPYRPLLNRLPPDRLPTSAELSMLAQTIDLEMRFSNLAVPLSAYEYERGINLTATIPTRPDNVHDFMNALVWLSFPKFKLALNRGHCLALEKDVGEAKQRSPFRDALTILDESGVLVVTQDQEFGELLVARQWQQLFVKRRDALAESTSFIVVGHGILEKLLVPYPSITGKCLIISACRHSVTEADPIAADALRNIGCPAQLPPLPVSGIPGWHPENHNAQFYDDAAIFRKRASPSHA
jgi:DUF3025 family protein